MTILYINQSHCTSLTQLKGYFWDSIDNNSDIYQDLLDYGRSLDISRWLQERGEDALASQLKTIDSELCDSDYFAEMCRILLGDNVQVSVKPDFLQCFSVENVKHEVLDTEATVSVSLKVLMSVNENFELRIKTTWGDSIASELLNSYSSRNGDVMNRKFVFRTQSNRDFGAITLFVDNILLLRTSITNDIVKDSIKVYKIGDVSFNMILVERGSFMMGATEEQKEPNNNEKPVHEVELPNDYYIGETQVTQGLWRAVMGELSSYFYDDRNKPMVRISWKDCQDFISKLNELSGEEFRLPTESEWEFAARGGNKSNHTQYSGSNIFNDVAWGNGNCGNSLMPVARKQPNELGLYDMSGNVWELCNDWYGEYSNFPQSNPTGPTCGDYHVLRGGYYRGNAEYSRISSRTPFISEKEIVWKDETTGFRLCL